MNLTKGESVGLHNREGYLGNSQDWKKSLRNQVSGTGPEELPPDLCLYLLLTLLVCFWLYPIGREALPSVKRAAGRPRFIPLSLTTPVKREHLSLRVHVSIQEKIWSCIPTFLNKVSQLLLCIKMISGAFENSDSQVQPAKIPIQWLEKPHEMGKRWFSKTKGH